MRLAPLALLLPLAAGPTVAQEAPPTSLDARFAGMDSDGDGLVSKDEFVRTAWAGMRQAGVPDGKVGSAAIPPAAAQAIERLFGYLDTDRDGSLSLAEVKAGRDGLRAEGAPVP